MKTWIGPSAELKDGDVITNWSRNGFGSATLEVQRLDKSSAAQVINRVHELGYDELAVDLYKEFGVEGNE